MGLTEQLAHACDLMVLTCIDYRLQTNDSQMIWLRRLYGNDRSFDLVTVPGSCHRLVREPASARSQLLDDIGVSVDLHQPERIAIVQHENCGRYHKSMNFPGWERERGILEMDLNQAVPHLHARFPNLEVHGLIARLSPAGFVLEMRRVLTVPPVAQQPRETLPAASM